MARFGVEGAQIHCRVHFDESSCMVVFFNERRGVECELYFFGGDLLSCFSDFLHFILKFSKWTL